MDGSDNLAMRRILAQLIEHANWTSRSWVDATLDAVGEAIREAGIATRAFDGQDEADLDPAERERVFLSALESCREDDELRTIGLRFLKLREQFRPLWSGEVDAPRRTGT